MPAQPYDQEQPPQEQSPQRQSPQGRHPFSAEPEQPGDRPETQADAPTNDQTIRLETSGPEHVTMLITGVDGRPPVFVPSYEHEGDAGADLRSAVDFDLAPFERKLVPLGFCAAFPDGYVVLVHPRSGLAIRQGVTLPNAPGTIDSGYRGEYKVPLINLDPTHTWHFKKGDRIAQMIVQRYWRADFSASDALPGSTRGQGGFGSTGLQKGRGLAGD